MLQSVPANKASFLGVYKTEEVSSVYITYRRRTYRW